MLKNMRLSLRLNLLTGLAVLGIIAVAIFSWWTTSKISNESDKSIRYLVFSSSVAHVAAKIFDYEVLINEYIISSQGSMINEIETRYSDLLVSMGGLVGTTENKLWDQQLDAFIGGFSDLGSRIVEKSKSQSSSFKTLPPLAYELRSLGQAVLTLSDQIVHDADQNLQIRDKATMRSLITAIVVLVTIIMAISILAYIISASVRVPIGQLITCFQRIRNKQFDDVKLPQVSNKNELGELAQAVQDFMDSEIESLKNAQIIEGRKAKRLERMRERDNKIRRFERATQDIIRDTAQATEQLESVSEILTKRAGVGQNQASEAGHAAENSMRDMGNITSASQELSASISEISGQVQGALSTVQRGVDLAESSKNKVANLLEQARSISAISAIIREISEQTNLLALNATIEAARAGDAGKGFAVVASEVKSLAQQIDKQTIQIDESVKAIQSTSGETAQAMDQIVDSIITIETVNQSIAAAVEEQSAATSEISHTVERTAGDVRSISNRVSRVAEASNETLSASHEVSSAAIIAIEQMNNLRTGIEDMLANLKDDNTTENGALETTA